MCIRDSRKAAPLALRERKVQRNGAALAVRRARLGRRMLGVYPNQAPQQVQDPLVTLLLIRAARALHIYSPSF